MNPLEMLRQLPKRAQVAVMRADGRMRWRFGRWFGRIRADHPRCAEVARRFKQITEAYNNAIDQYLNEKMWSTCALFPTTFVMHIHHNNMHVKIEYKLSALLVNSHNEHVYNFKLNVILPFEKIPGVARFAVLTHDASRYRSDANIKWINRYAASHPLQARSDSMLQYAPFV